MGHGAVVNPPRESQPGGHPLGDPVLAALVGALLAFGLVMLYSASFDFLVSIGHPPLEAVSRQLLWLLLGLAGAAFMALVDYHRWQRWALPLISVSILLLVLVIFIGEQRYGASRGLWGGSVQPSELAKLSVIIYLAVWLYAKRDFLHTWGFGLLPLGIILGVVAGLILLQPDLSAGVTVFLLGTLLYMLSVRDLRIVAILLGVAVLLAAVMVGVIPTGRVRMASYLTGLRDPLESSYHMQRAVEAVVNGGLTGMGLGQGVSKWYGWLPFPHTDSIYAVIVEELGLLGGLAVWGGFVLLFWRGIRIASRAPDMLGTLLASGITFWIVGEALLNMGVMVGVFPFAGNALPFFSAGGSNLVVTLAGVGLLLNIARQGRTNANFWRFSHADSGLRRRNRRGRVPRAGRAASVEE